MSKVLIVCAQRYNGHELWVALMTLQQRNHTFEVVSTECTIQDEITLRPNVTDRTVYEIALEEANTFDGMMVVSGNMEDTEAYWDDTHVLSLLKAFKQLNKPIAAICCSVPTLSPVVKDTKVSFFPLIRSKQRLKAAGAILQTVAVTVHNNIATAEHQMATQMWSQEFCNLLEGKVPDNVLVDSGYVPQGRPRKFKPEIQKFLDARTTK